MKVNTILSSYISILSVEIWIMNRSSRPEVFYKKGFLRNFAKFTGKQRLWHRCFSVNFAKFLRTPCLTEHLGWVLGHQDLRLGTPDSDTWDPEPWDPRLWDPGPWDPETWDPGTLELGPWALGLATLGHGVLTPGTLIMGSWDPVTSNMRGHAVCVKNVGARIQK